MTHAEKHEKLKSIMHRYGMTHKLIRFLTRESQWRVGLWLLDPENERSREIPDNQMHKIELLAEMLDPNTGKIALDNTIVSYEVFTEQ